MINNQRHLFNMPDNVNYLNCAYMSPLLNQAAEAGCQGVKSKTQPWKISSKDFFTDSNTARALFADLVKAKANDIALIPSVSYGSAVAALNLPIKSNEKILVLAEEFPSNIYVWRQKAKQHNAEIKTVERPSDHDWTSAILEALDERVKVVVLPHTHWIDGIQINLDLISRILRKFGCALVLDLTQSLGVVGIDVNSIKPDFLICASYKWLLGPYSFGFLYADPKHHEGKPLEHGWVNRPGAENFSRLIDYTDELNPDASRFDVGERSNLQLLPIVISALKQIHDWKPAYIEASLSAYTDELAENLYEIGFTACPKKYRSPHYLSVTHKNTLPSDLLAQLANENVYISQRGDHLRITPHLYNDLSDMQSLISALKKYLR